MRPSLIDTAGYQPQTVEKVERLLELLAETGAHPYLGPRLRLHGGTALNIFHISMPRLSVDADLTYMGRVPKDEYECERPEVERAMANLGKSLGYTRDEDRCSASRDLSPPLRQLSYAKRRAMARIHGAHSQGPHAFDAGRQRTRVGDEPCGPGPLRVHHQVAADQVAVGGEHADRAVRVSCEVTHTGIDPVLGE